jgi:hypothetical protein
MRPLRATDVPRAMRGNLLLMASIPRIWIFQSLSFDVAPDRPPTPL